MKKAVARLEPYIEAEKTSRGQDVKGKIVMATVKGDVHDIGKNIVGVVLRCNNYEVIDLGVMVPADKILAETAIAERGRHDRALGPDHAVSLDEMACGSPRRWRPTGFKLPLLIGGATTSEIHTAVKIDPAYHGPVIHVADASRAVGVVTSLVGDRAESYCTTVAERYEEVRQARARPTVPLRPLDEAKANRATIDWSSDDVTVPSFLGVRQFDIELTTLRDYIDWTPFFRAWDLAGSYPRLLDDEVVGQAARELYADGVEMLDQFIADRLLTADAVVGFWPANATGDDITVYADETRGDVAETLHTLRQQVVHADDRPNLALADFVAPADSGVADYVGAFTVTTGGRAEELAAAYEADNDDYRAIMVKALADRLAEACAEYLHHRVRTELWGYEDRNYTNDELIRERYRGIRPAPGYPACPDHTEKRTIFRMLDTEARIGTSLTESCAMTPAASVSGLYFAHPESRYFGVRRIGDDQVADYAERKGMDEDEVRRWLAPLLR